MATALSGFQKDLANTITIAYISSLPAIIRRDMTSWENSLNMPKSGVGKHTDRSRDGGFHIEIIKGQQDAPHCEYPEKQHGVGGYGRRYPCRDRLSVHHDSPDHIWMYLLQQAIAKTGVLDRFESGRAKALV